MTLCIRKAQTEDTARIVELVNSAYRPVPGTEGWTHETALVSGARVQSAHVAQALESSTVLVGVLDSRLVGCVEIQTKGKEAYIGMLAVQPALQAGGLGKQLLAEAEQYAEEHLGAEQFALVVIASRTELLQFYIRRGYTETGEQLAYPLDSGVGNPKANAMALTVLRKPASRHESLS